MKKSLKILCFILIIGFAFVLGWRVMPKVWPGIKEAVVYPVFPQMKPAPEPTQEPYTPKSTAAFEDTIAATDSLVYYFYKDYCPWCRQLEPLTAGLPARVTLPDGTESAVKLVCLNKVEEEPLRIITEYYDAYQIAEERQYVPAVVIGDRYLFANEEIIGQLMEALVNGEGLQTPLLNGQERSAVH